MKKIVSVLSVAALTLSAVFAADVSLNYRLGGSLYSEINTKEIKADGSETAEQTREALNLEGYGDSGIGDLKFTAMNDFAGFVLKVNINDSDAYETREVSEYYGWLNFSNIQVTAGKWDSRYVGLLTDDAGEWENNEYARYKPGVIGGKYAFDIDNLTKVRTSAGDWEQRLGTAVAYTNHPSEDSYFMVKGVLFDSDWGSTLRTDSDRAYGDDYVVGNGDLNFFSGFAGEVAFRTAAFDINFAAKSMYRDELGLGVFFRTIGDTSLLFGLSSGLDLSDTEDVNDSNYREFAFDFRGRFKLSEQLTLTTMNNLSVLNNAKAKDQDYDEMDFHLWDMVSIAYQANEKVLAQLTVESECDPLLIRAENTEPGDDWTATNNGAKGSTTFGASATGGFTITVVPGVTYSLNENATITAGVAVEWYNIGASPVYQDSWKGDGKDHATSTIQIPVVFKVDL